MIHTPVKYLEALQPAPGYHYDEERAESVINWFEKYLSLTSAKWEGKAFNFLPWQELIFRPLYGFVDDNGLRQFNTVFIFVPKKNGKTELSSGMALYHLIGDNEPTPEVYVVASNEDQAKICWEGSLAMINQSPTLQRAKLDSKHNPLRIISPMNRGIFRALSSKVSGKQGLRPSAIICDEMHEWRGRAIYDSLTHENATMTRDQPLRIIITTAGDDEEDIQNLCQEMYTKALAIQNGELEDIHFLPAVWSADKEEDWTSIEVAKQVCPSWGYTIKEDVIRKLIETAKKSELEEANYKKWTLNMFVKKNSRRWLSISDWDDNSLHREDDLDRQKLDRMADLFEDPKIPKYAGLDFAPLRDLCSISMMCRDPITELLYVKQFSWCTQVEADRKSKAENVPFNAWGDAGWLVIVPDKIIEPKQMGEYLLMTLLLYPNVVSLAYDKFRISAVMNTLEETGRLKVPAVDIPNTTKSLNESSIDLSDLILTHQLYHEADPLMRYCVDNVTCISDSGGLIKPDKSSTVLKIDPVVATIYANDCRLREESKQSAKIRPFKNNAGVSASQTHDLGRRLGVVG